jgi:cation transport ATPase
MRPPLHNEAELRAYDRMQIIQQHSYDMTARLTYFVISAELIFCGYVLLNADRFGQIKYLSVLFLMSGLAAFFGVFWRFFYNQTYHDNAHGILSIKGLNALQAVVYWLYVVLSIIFFAALLWAGYIHLSEISAKPNVSVSTERISVEKTNKQLELNKASKPTQ